MTAGTTTQPLADVVSVPVSIRLLGPMELSQGRVPSADKWRQTIALLAFKANEFVSMREFNEALWQTSILKPPQSIHTYILQLRKNLPWLNIETRRHGYLLRLPSRLCVDVHLFHRVADQGARLLAEGDTVGAVGALRAALDLWRGTALADVTQGPLLADLVTTVEERRLSVLAMRFEAEQRLGHHREIVDELAAVIRGNPGREDLVARHALALYRSERRADALAAIDRCRRWLKAEIGVDPGITLQRLRQQILRGEVDGDG